MAPSGPLVSYATLLRLHERRGMTGRDDLKTELDRWQAAGLEAGIWWRDDDLGAPSPALDHLLRTAMDLSMTPLLAVVPKWATSDLPNRLAGQPVQVALHGWAHVDHEAGRGKKSEFGPARPIADLLADVSAGRERLVDLFGDDLACCFVPPWNRMIPELAHLLPSEGIYGLSLFGRHPNQSQTPNLDLINTHVDVINWRVDRRFIGADAMAKAIAVELAGRRWDRVGADEPIGILTHHLEMVADDWRAFESVGDVLVTHPAARMLRSRDLFGRWDAP